MADPILHIKDSYYFEVPKFLARSNNKYTGKYFPEFWVRLDDQFQDWEADRLYKGLEGAAKEGAPALPDYDHLKHEWDHWRHDHANHGKPFDVFLEEHAALLNAEFKSWKSQAPENKDKTFDEFLAAVDARQGDFAWFAVRLADPQWATKWSEIKETAGGDKAVSEFQEDPAIVWAPKKIEGYHNALHGKILIPQPFGRQKNLYEMEPGQFGISKYMILEVVVAVVIVAVFGWLASRMKTSDRPKGKCWNLLESVLLFIRDQVARPAIDSHDHHDADHVDHGHAEHAHADHGHGEHGHAQHAAKKHEEHEGDKYVPYLWTVFLFILGCNLMGMLPWSGSPTAAFGVTLALAAATFLVGMVSGMRKFGFFGYWKNQVPGMELPSYMAVVLLPAIFVIEVMGLFIKHGVLGIRLLANIAAGHLVLVSLLALTFSAAGASEALNTVWPFASVVVVLGSAALSCLELFVAFLQAYVFTLLSALFIGAAVHKH